MIMTCVSVGLGAYQGRSLGEDKMMASPSLLGDIRQKTGQTHIRWIEIKAASESSMLGQVQDRSMSVRGKRHPGRSREVWEEPRLGDGCC